MTKKIDKMHEQFFASCPTGLEELLKAEIQQLNPKDIHLTKGGVHFGLETAKAIELMLSSRIASRIYKKAYQFEIKQEKDLYFFAKEIKWKALFNLDQTFKISVQQSKNAKGERSKFKSSMFLAQNLKDGIVDRYRHDTKGERPNIDKDRPDISFLLHLEPNENPHSQKEIATILIDMCGHPLSQRGYRDTNFSAPLKESLAAGLVLLSGYTGKEDFIDPMCGSGTIIIESLLIKGSIPPSFIAVYEIQKHSDEAYWDFLAHNWFAKDKYLLEAWDKLIKEYHQKTIDGFEKLQTNPAKTLAFDQEKYALNAIKFNLKSAELTDFVTLVQEDATKLSLSSVDSGIIVTNPPYGERVGQEEILPTLYYEFGENLKKNFKGFKAFLFTGNLALIKKISLRTSKKHILYNGAIESRFVEYQLF